MMPSKPITLRDGLERIAGATSITEDDEKLVRYAYAKLGIDLEIVAGVVYIKPYDVAPCSVQVATRSLLDTVARHQAKRDNENKPEVKEVVKPASSPATPDDGYFIRTKKFRDKRTGEIVERFNVMDIAHMEEVD